MTVITIDLYEAWHVCPANLEPHAVSRSRSIIDITPGGPCRTPVTVRVGDVVREIDCRRHEPTERQCVACKPLFIIPKTVHTDLGWQGPIHLVPCLHRSQSGSRTEVTA